MRWQPSQVPAAAEKVHKHRTQDARHRTWHTGYRMVGTKPLQSKKTATDGMSTGGIGFRGGVMIRSNTLVVAQRS